MAARLEPVPTVRTPNLVELRHLTSVHLSALLAEETSAWQEMLNWDFNKSADLVRRFVDLRALSGCALMDGGEAVGYSYFVIEEHKGLVGDLYVRKEFRTAENENRLLAAVLERLVTGSQVRRVESQLMMILGDRSRSIPGAQYLATFERNYMLIDFESAPALPLRPLIASIHLEKWSDRHQETAAQLIASAYTGHIDSRINDQYRSLGGARRFLYNIVQYPGCGSFFQPASFVAIDLERGSLAGLVLASLVGEHTGHITQVCVSTEDRGIGLGYELMRQSLEIMRAHGCRKASLTVTASNREAVSLYERMGFRTVRKFLAYVWEGFGRQ
ncbi:MAG TPA: GNAT family N-acetyltransferase [Bryobacteraceae bacterium]|nr:GNAT family N-acetyltransferase [Bryobacteraceae bacterium]